MSDPTVVEEITALRARGFTADFSVPAGGGLRCDTCRRTHRPTLAVVESTARFEGSSNPDDEAIVFGLRCVACGAKGVLVMAYGPAASADEAAVVTALAPRGAP